MPSSDMTGGQSPFPEVESCAMIAEVAQAHDGDPEAAVAESLQRIHNETDITVILVSHEPETVRDADQIAVIEAGCITAVGEHETLMRSSLWYRNTFINAADSAVA